MIDKNRESLVLTLDPRMAGGVHTMHEAVCDAHEALGLNACLVYARSSRVGRFDWRIREAREGGRNTLSVGYLPSIEYLNYLVPALALKRRLRSHRIVQLVCGTHALSLMPIVAKVPFVSWVATPFWDEIESRSRDQSPSLSVRLNKGLGSVNSRLEGWSFKHPSRVFALSKYTARRISDVVGLAPSNIDVLYCPVDTKLFRPDGARAEGMPSRYIVSVGRIDDERKNIRSLIRSFAPVARAIPDVHLVIVGPHSPQSPLLAFPRELGIADRVRFTGALSGGALAEVCRGAELFAMTSRQEGLGIVVLEAQASGIAPVLMRCGGSDELVNDGTDGWLVEQGDEEKFTSILIQLLNNKDMTREAGAKARSKVIQVASKDAFRNRLADAYRMVFPGSREILGS